MNVDKYLRKADGLLQAGNHEEAGAVLHIALNFDPNNSMALWNLAYSYMKAERWGLAYNLLKRAKEVDPGNPGIWCNLAATALSMASPTQDDKMMDEAEHLLTKAIRKAGDKPPPLNHLALIAVNRGEPERAVQFCERSLKLDPDQRDCRETLGYALLSMGNWREGFKNYDYSIGAAKVRMPKPFAQEPLWEGQKGRLFLRGEQGIGDEISYASVIPDAAKDNEVTYECDKRLEGLMRRSLPGVTVYGTRFQPSRYWSGEFDYHALTGMLCSKYRSNGEFPRKAFLVADPERRLQWRALLDTLPGKKVGIAWAGGLPNTFSGRRSFALERLLPLLKIPGITWVSLQYKDAAKDIEFVETRVKIHHWERAVGKEVDYDETAALVAELDCVVSICTAVVHLCGALGKKCLVLVPNKPRWFYGREGKEHAWYESLELYRQTDKWPIERVQQRLKEYLEG